MLKDVGEDIEGKVCVVSGAGNVAIYTIEKLYELGAKPITASDSSGFIHDPAGINLDLLKQIKEVDRRSLADYAAACSSARFIPVSDYPANRNPLWSIPCDAAFPSATQNELNGEDARALLNGGCQLVAEGANMPCSQEAVDIFLEAGTLYGPGKAANAGGVATSQLEMSQNASMEQWSFEQVDNRLHDIMACIYRTASETAKQFGQPGNLVLGANIAGFRKVADAMIDQGVV
jgi:glutamate dehydrogenase (NADP+)